jgi:hypothetical protein
MARGAIDTYLETVYTQFRFHATWPAGSLVVLGDIGEIRDGAFVRTSSIADKGVNFKRQRRDAPSIRFATRGGVEFRGTISGETDQAVSTIGKLDAGLKVTFKRQGALVFVMDPAEDEFIRDVDGLADWMHTQMGQQMRPEEVIVTHIRRARSGLIAMASESGAEVQLKTNAQIGTGELDIANVKGNLELVHAWATDFVSVPRGRSGTTPLYRMLHYDDPSICQSILGTGPERIPRVSVVSQRMVGNVGMSPAPPGVRGRAALRPS